jgi:hypothetical protein
MKVVKISDNFVSEKALVDPIYLLSHAIQGAIPGQQSRIVGLLPLELWPLQVHNIDHKLGQTRMRCDSYGNHDMQQSTYVCSLYHFLARNVHR